MKKSFPLSKVYGLLEPGPVVLVTTAQKGRANVMTLSWLTMMDFEPPLVGMVMSDRNFSFAALKATKECVINIPTVELAGKVVAVGNRSGRSVVKGKWMSISAGVNGDACEGLMSKWSQPGRLALQSNHHSGAW